VSYTYDSLNRLIAASTSGTGGVQWGNSYSYDGFGNLTGKTVTKGTAPTLSPIVDSTTNQVRPGGDYGYDANGNWLGVPGAPNTWNVENQLLSTGTVDGNGNPVTYTYDPWGRRVLQFSASNYGPSGTLYFYSITGQRLALCTAGYPTQTSCAPLAMYFGKRPLAAIDRLGSVRGHFGYTAAIAYYPWGEERPQSDGTLTPDATDKFATYFRDAFGQDYANARYYNSNLGRFWTADPLGVKAVDPKNPTSWNLYAYVNGDPVNFRDPGGLFLSAYPSEDGGDDPPDFDVCVLYPYYPGCGARQTASRPDKPDPRPLGFNGAKNDLAKSDCYKMFGYSSAEAAQTAFGSLTFQSGELGELRIQTTPDGTQTVDGSPSPAWTIENTVTINSDYGPWIDLSGVPALNVTTGQQQSFNWLGAVNDALGTNMTTSQLSALMLLHEFEHSDMGGGAPQETAANSVAFNTTIYNNCIK
jgi:RHS repeat-associated protein